MKGFMTRIVLRTGQPGLAPPQKVIEILNIVEDDEIIDNELEMDDTEADDETIIDVKPIIDTKDEEEIPEDKIFIAVEVSPEFPGGVKGLYNYISKNVNYPVVAQENGIQGIVYVKFVVSETGSVANAEILRGVDTALDKEALRVINSLPKFKPGKQQGRPVKVYYNARINFQLQN